MDQDQAVLCLSSSEDTGFGQWDVHRVCQNHGHWNFEMGLLSFNLVVPLLTAWSVWLISVLHALWKLCDSAAAMLASIFLMLAAVVMWGTQPWRGVFMSTDLFTKQRNPSSKMGGRGNADSEELCAVHQGCLLFCRAGYFSATSAWVLVCHHKGG